jgi:hypothetical protein
MPTRATSRARVLPGTDTLDALIVVAAFVVSRVVFYLAGIRYMLQYAFWQLLDQNQLRHHSAQALIHLQDQPPLFNAFTALVLRWPSSLQHYVAGLFALGLGLLLVLSAFFATRALTPGRAWAYLVAAFVILGPAYVLYENWYFYTYATTAFLCFTVLALVKVFQRRSRWWALGYVAALGLVVLSNSTFQWPWMILGLVPLGVALKWNWTALAKVALVPLVVVAGWYGKNAVMFGAYSTSSWMGLNLANPTFHYRSHALNAKLVTQGYSKVILLSPFSPLGDFVPRFVAPHPPTGVAVLDAPEMAQQGLDGKVVVSPNFNNLDYLPYSNLYLTNDLRFIAGHTSEYASSVLRGTEIFLAPADQYPFLEPDRTKIAGYSNLYNKVVMLQFSQPAGGNLITNLFYGLPQPFTQLSLTELVLLLATMLGVPVGIALRRRSTPKVWISAYISMTAIYVFLVTNLVELGENNRFQMDLGPLPLIATFGLVSAAWNWRHGRHAHGARPSANATATN